jgi:aspartyl-tRNA(Asn)/glutamyl-tRNA(Gln) amidotransferase subunit B
MARIPTSALREYLLKGRISTLSCLRKRQQLPVLLCSQGIQQLHTNATKTSSTIPFRKQLKDEAAKLRKSAGPNRTKANKQKLDDWELTVGIEIHAQLNTARKLFSPAAASINDEPNTHVALFDVAIPGSQPTFQKETLIPAIRAALALNCTIQKTSKFDRKHYFHWDQPSGYQITQYYQPLAKDGYITLYAHDGIAKEDGKEIRIGIKQVQMEQDTAKTISRTEGEHLLDFNRVGLPLIEIITLPQIHHPQTAAALVRKIQILLNAVDACVLGMQSGGLRADVNVSVRRRNGEGYEGNQYAGVKGLGQRTEIKNLSSFKAVEDAIIAERDRQIEVLESGGVVEGETRGWTIGSTETRRLRGKEGEVDYRYMPDPDLGPVVIGDDLLHHLQSTLGVLPDDDISLLTSTYGLTTKDALTLVSLNDGGRAEYFHNVVDELVILSGDKDLKRLGKLAGDWVLHALGGLVSDTAEDENALRMTSDGDCVVPYTELSSLVYFLDSNKITGKTAKRLLPVLFENETNGIKKSVKEMIDEDGLWFDPLPDEKYEEIAREVADSYPNIVQEVLVGDKKGLGKLNFLLGQMMRRDDEGRMDPQIAAKVIEKVVEEYRK